ncbi:MAG: hypothetical protein KIT84_37475 [Labilithrix sp.]|nr:hypothetical protein [Labilithrix sp.]MCW5816751.1 hypothetical protein [Labilithrix sp.]
MKPLTTRITWIALALAVQGCAAGEDEDVAESSEQNLELFNASKWFRWLERTHPDWAVRSSARDADPSPWPRGFAPERAEIFAHNEVFLEGVSPLEVHDLMTRPREYRSFYPNSGAPSVDRLTSVGQTYRWSTFGVTQSNTVVELQRDARESRLAWLAESTGTKALHRWIFRAEAGGTRVITEECQTGWVAGLPSLVSSMATSLPAAHELWLQGLRCRMVEGAKDEEMCTTTIRKDLGSAPDP